MRLNKNIEIFIKRVIDIVGSTIGLAVLSPIFLVIALLIKLDSPGPSVFLQSRVGKDGKRFTFYKFRSMYANCNEELHRKYMEKLILDAPNENMMGKVNIPDSITDRELSLSNPCSINASVITSMEEKTLKTSGGCFKLENDPRITRLGKFLRKSSLDELPQLINVLKGEMSLVGPRPAIPYEVEMYKPWHMRRLSVKPGITGLWQVSGRSNKNFQEMIELDLQYIDNWSIWLDIKIILKTFGVVFSRKGAW